MYIFPILAILIIYSLACLGAGKLALLAFSRRRQVPDISAGSMTATVFLLGQGLLANLWLILASASLFKLPVVKIIVLVLSITGYLLNHRLLIETARHAGRIYRNLRAESFDWKLAALLTSIVWFAWITSLGQTPNIDGAGFYLALAKVIAASERLAPLPGYETLTSIGLQGEMNYAAIMALGRAETSQLFMWLTMTAGSILLLALSRRMGLKRRGQWVVFAMIFTSSAVVLLSGSGKTDLFAASFAFAAYYWMFKIGEDEGRIAYLLTGIFCGLAFVGKISYLVTFIPSILIILAWIFSTRKEATRLTPILIMGSGVCLVVLPHLIKNQILFQNPLAPLGMEGVIEQTWYGPETTRRLLLTLPFALTFGDYWAQIGNLSPMVLMFAPLLAHLQKPRRFLESPLVILGLAACIGILCWFAFRPTILAPRYFLGTLLVLAVPVAKAGEAFAETSTIRRHLISGTLSLVAILTWFYHSTNTFFPERTIQLITNGALDCGIEKNRCLIEASVNPVLEPGERLFMNDAFRYWLRPDLIQCALSSEETQTYLSLEHPEQRWSYIIGKGFRWVLVANTLSPLGNAIRNDLKEIPDWLDVQIENEEKIFLLHLTTLDERHIPLFACRQTTPPAWNVVELYIP